MHAGRAAVAGGGRRVASIGYHEVMAPRLTDFRYMASLHLRRDLQGRGRWIIVDLTYPFVWEEDDTRWYKGTVPANFETDLASIPQPVQWLISKLDAHVEAAVVHDYLYRFGARGIELELTNVFGRPCTPPRFVTRTIDRRTADRVFLAAMRTARVARWKRGLMFLAVRVGAWWAYSRP